MRYTYDKRQNFLLYRVSSVENLYSIVRVAFSLDHYVAHIHWLQTKTESALLTQVVFAHWLIQRKNLKGSSGAYSLAPEKKIGCL